MRALTAVQKAALRDPSIVVATFLEMAHPDGTLYLWSGSGIIDHDGKQWLGCGLVAGITGIESSTDPRVSKVAFVLTGVPGDTLNVTSTDLKGRQATIYHGLLRSNSTLIGALITADVVDLDTQTTTAADDGSFTIVVTGQSGFWQLEHPSLLFWSPEQQAVDFPGDTGMDALAELEDLEITWTRT